MTLVINPSGIIFCKGTDYLRIAGLIERLFSTTLALAYRYALKNQFDEKSIISLNGIGCYHVLLS